jgi:organic hydroperoxide reductase OsmC/OhrA
VPRRHHTYRINLRWTDAQGTGTSSYSAYSRAHEVVADGKPTILGSADPAFRGDAARWNPEELLVAALSACHKLWYLHLCADSGIVVTAYEDHAEGEMVEEADGAGQMIRVVLRPQVTLKPGSDAQTARALHHAASDKCFIRRSVNFPVVHEPRITIAV